MARGVRCGGTPKSATVYSRLPVDMTWAECCLTQFGIKPWPVNFISRIYDLILIGSISSVRFPVYLHHIRVLGSCCLPAIKHRFKVIWHTCWHRMWRSSYCRTDILHISCRNHYTINWRSQLRFFVLWHWYIDMWRLSSYAAQLEFWKPLVDRQVQNFL